MRITRLVAARLVSCNDINLFASLPRCAFALQEKPRLVASSPRHLTPRASYRAMTLIFATIGGTLCGSRPTLTPSLMPELTATLSVTSTPDPDARATPTHTATATVTPTPAPPIGDLVMPGGIAQPLHQGAVTSVVAITLAAGVTLVDGTRHYWPAADPHAISTLATGLTGQGGALLATVDTTVLANDSYIVRLTGTNAQGVTQASGVRVTVAGSYKPGRVRFEVTDLTIPVTGLPITVGRTYDSLERDRSGDFGYGWSLSLGNPRLTVDPAHHVTLTMPNGERVTFHVTPRSYGGLFGALLQPAYTPEAGVYGTLTADGCPILVAGGSGYLCFLARPHYAPTVYTYEDPYGQVFTLAADGTLEAITDRHANVLRFSPNGIVSSNGMRLVAFARDAQGRITQITDPAGNTYGYDGAGDLVEIDLPDVETHVQYAYADPTYPHLFTSATDPRGHPSAQTTFDAAGRLDSVTDALGHTTRYAYDVPGRVTTVTNPDGGTLTLVYDAYGMVRSETDPLGRTTTSTYDTNHNVISRTNALGNTATFTYDNTGNQVATTNHRGETTIATYGRYSQLTSQTDLLGMTRTIAYDTTFKPTGITDDLGTLAGFTFNDRGSLLQFTDANGQTTHYTYDPYGNLLIPVSTSRP